MQDKFKLLQDKFKFNTPYAATFEDMRELFFILFIICYSGSVFGQELGQTIRGNILDIDSQQPLIGATIALANLQSGTVSDADGQFRLENIPLGRQELIVSYLGYEEKILSNIILNARKEVVLTIYLQESIAELAIVVVKANQDKSGSINDFRTDIKISYRFNRPKISHEVFVNVDNVFNISNVFAEYYSPLAQNVVTINQLGRFPTFQYTITF